MKASKLIEKLKEAIKENGDNEVYIDSITKAKSVIALPQNISSHYKIEGILII